MKTATMSSLLALLLLLFSSVTLVTAFPNGSPTCIADTSAPGQPHRLSTGFTEESLPASGLQLSIGGQPVLPDTPIDLAPNVAYEVVLIAASDTTSLRGFMTRLAGGDANVDTSAVFTLADDEAELQFLSACPENVSIVLTVTTAGRAWCSILLSILLVHVSNAQMSLLVEPHSYRWVD